MKNIKVKFGIIGGYSFFKQLNGLKINVKTPYGEVRGIKIGKLKNIPVAMLDRHGIEHELPPHKINYRANIFALKRIGVQWVIAYAAVGSLKEELRPGDIVVPHDFIDLSITRASFFEGGDTSRVRHVDLSSPFCPSVRQALISAARKLEVEVKPYGVYICTEGPRFETPAEIRALKLLGADVVGMTVAREAGLAKEIGLCYATSSLVSNYGCGITPHIVSYKEIVKIMHEKKGIIESIITEAIKILNKNPPCNCQEFVKMHAYLEKWPGPKSKIIRVNQI